MVEKRPRNVRTVLRDHLTKVGRLRRTLVTMCQPPKTYPAWRDAWGKEHRGWEFPELNDSVTDMRGVDATLFLMEEEIVAARLAIARRMEELNEEGKGHG